MSAVRTNVMRLLENAGIPFTVHEYSVEDGLLDAVSMARKIGREPESVFKTLVTANPGREHFVFVIPGPATLDLKKAASAASSKSIAMIPQKELFPLTGYIHGGCSPVGLKKPFPVFLDETAQLFETFCVSGGHVGVCIELRPADLAGYLGAAFRDLI